MFCPRQFKLVLNRDNQLGCGHGKLCFNQQKQIHRQTHIYTFDKLFGGIRRRQFSKAFTYTARSPEQLHQ